jgi:glutamate--cysteine ligase
MSAPASGIGAPIESKEDLVQHIASGNKPISDWTIGTEHEKFGFDLETLRQLPYDGPAGIRALLEGLQRFGWEPVNEGENPIALLKDGCSITLEPGGQFELSGAMLRNLHETCSEVHTHLAQVKQIGDEIGVGMLGLGFQPKWKREDIPWMPKGRYKIMRDYMAKMGNLGQDMMLRSSTVQVNLDYSSEADMVKKFRVSLALQPIATALFANSPFKEGKVTDFKTFRAHVWTDTDPDRTGRLPFVFEDGMGFERYVDYALDVPMYFAYRNGEYLDASGLSFRDFMKGELSILPGEVATMSDWADHLTTIFPDVRLKTFLEMRGADGGPWGSLCALPAFWVGLLYDQSSLDAAWDLVKDWNDGERQALERDVPVHALQAPFRNTTVQEIARQAVAISRAGLERRAIVSKASGLDETQYLAPLEHAVETGKSPADILLDKFNGTWDKNIDRVFEDMAY